MGKVLIIKGADFSAVAVDTVTPIIPVTINLSAFNNENGVINGSNKWTLSSGQIPPGVFNHKMMPVTPGAKYRITGISEQTYLPAASRSNYKSKIAFLTAYDTPTEGGTPSFSTDPDFTGRIVLGFDEVINVTIPSDAAYMYIFNNDVTSTKPDGTTPDALPLVELILPV